MVGDVEEAHGVAYVPQSTAERRFLLGRAVLIGKVQHRERGERRGGRGHLGSTPSGTPRMSPAFGPPATGDTTRAIP